MSELSDLIERLKRGISTNAGYIQSIKYPRLLIKSLEELRDLIGNEKVKDSVATQITHLIMVKQRIAKGFAIGEDDVMLNTALYGPPGVGKTLIGKNLAKIWYSLGFLDGSRNPTRKRDFGNLIGDMFNNGNDNTNIEDDPYMLYYLLAIYLGFIAALFSMAWSFYTKFGGAWTIGVILILGILIILGWFLISGALYDEKENKNKTKNKNEIRDKPIENNHVQAAPNIDQIPSDDEVIKVVTRADFVDKYVGWTSLKTKKLLEDNLGKVLFVDEAYSMINGPHDEFGVEALNTLNLFLSQRPKEIIVIFAGYKDLLESGPYSVQPGLKRRFMWKFDCKGYSPEELYEIFKFQLKNKNWKLSDDEATRKLFYTYYNDFPAYGGDTERAAFFSELEHSREYIGNSENMGINVLTPDHITKGILKLRENNMEDDDQASTNPMANMMKMLKKPQNESKQNTSSDFSEESIMDLMKNIRNTVPR